MTTVIDRQPRYRNGRWAETCRQDPGNSMLGQAWPGWEPADQYPYPQANDLDKVALSVDVVAAGADTSDAIGYALGITDRQGAYYADCAAWMTFLERYDHPDTASEYRLTEAGIQFAALDNVGRAQVLAAIVDQCEDTTGTETGVVARLRHEGLSENTARRRAATMRSWRAQISSRTLGPLIGQTAQSVKPLLSQARDLANRQHSRRATITVLRGAQCATCYQTMPLSGICDNCSA